MEPPVGRSAQPVAAPLQGDVGVDRAGVVRVEGGDVDPAQRRRGRHHAGRLARIQVELTRPHRQPQPERAVLARQPEHCRLTRAQRQGPESSGAVERHLLAGRRLAVGPRGVETKRALRGLGVAGELERHVIKGAGAAEAGGADDQSGVPPEDGAGSCKVDSARRGPAVDDLHRPGHLTGREHRTRADGQLQVGGGGSRAAERQGAGRHDPACVCVDAGQVHPARHEAEGGRGARRTIGALARRADGAVQARGTLGEGQVQVRRLEWEVGNVDGCEISGQVGARSVEGPGDGPLALGLATDLDRPGLERALGAPGGLQGDGALEIDLAGGRGAGFRAVEAGAGDGEDAARQGRIDTQPRLAAQQPVQLVQAAAEAPATSIGCEPPGLGGRRLAGRPCGLQGSAGPGVGHAEVGERQAAGKAKAPQQAAVPVRSELEAGPLGVGLADQQPPVLQPDEVHRRRRSRPRQPCQGPLAVSAGALERGLQRQLTRPLAEGHGASHRAEAIAAEIEIGDAGDALEGPGLRIAGQQALGPSGAHRGRGEDAGEGGNDDGGRQSLVRTESCGVGRTLETDREVGRGELAGHAVKAAGRSARRQSHADLGPDHPRVRRCQAGGGERRPAGDGAPFGGPSAVRPGGACRAGTDLQVQASRGAGSGGAGDDHQGLVRAKAESACEGAALRLHGVSDDLERAGAAKAELKVQPVALVQQAHGRHRSGLAEVAAFQPERPRDVEESPPGAERRQGLQPEAHRSDVEGDGQPSGRRALLPQGRPAQDTNAFGGDRVDLQPARDQEGVAPADVQLVGFEPDPLLVDDGQPADGEVAPDIAADALDFQAADITQLESAGPRLQQEPALVGQHAEPNRRDRCGDDQDHGDQPGHRPARGAARTSGPAARPSRRRRWRSAGQNACPMLR